MSGTETEGEGCGASGARTRCQALVLAGAHVGGFRDSQVNKDEQRVHDDEHHDGDLNL